jgi:hypothetical protein
LNDGRICALRSQFTDFGGDLQADAPLRQHHRAEAEPDAKGLVFNDWNAADAPIAARKPGTDGNSPPARNLALSPEIAVSVGSASPEQTVALHRLDDGVELNVPIIEFAAESPPLPEVSGLNVPRYDKLVPLTISSDVDTEAP